MKFLVFEGLDGAGKSTMIKKLSQYLMHGGSTVTVTREPGGTPLGEELRRLLLRTDAETPVPKCEILLYEAIRAQHVQKVILPALAKGHWVLCDRFTASSIAFQAAGRSLPITQINWLNEFATDQLKPDLNILLDLPPELSMDRQKLRGFQTGQKADRFESEKIEFHKRVRASFLDLTKNHSSEWLVIDAQLTPEDSFQEILSYLRSLKWLP